MKKIGLLICLFFIFIFESEAKCEYSEVARLKEYASNINISYDYRIQNGTVYFKTTLNNIIPQIYIIDNKTNIKYTYSNTNNGELVIDNYTDTSGDRYVMYASGGECDGKRLLSKYYSFPQYNIYYNSKECEGIQNYYLCKKWVSRGTSFNNFYENIEDYKNSQNEALSSEDEEDIIIETSLVDEFFRFYAKYYYLILIPIISVCVILILYQRKKEKFKL